jgi:aspartyl-tRNA(Asn)/glutamyl-tRNA(Gln) amidotransferase subunit C
MKITTREVLYIAELARLELSTEEVESFTADMNRILDYMDQLQELDTSGVEPTSHVLSLKNVFREDVVGDSLAVDEVFANAPRREKGHFVVPRIIE